MDEFRFIILRKRKKFARDVWGHINTERAYLVLCPEHIQRSEKLAHTDARRALLLFTMIASAAKQHRLKGERPGQTNTNCIAEMLSVRF
jgi:hypothetical protein